MKTRSTTILSVRCRGMVAIGGDGQVSLGQSIMKADANKIRGLHLPHGEAETDNGLDRVEGIWIRLFVDSGGTRP